ncbi:MAG TPA: hypothetical protein VLG67_04365 [Candidatus Saccharimonadales bacterium]|nr:hypothetical protein [Candidatus Saccharimonadales bacterium]
MRKEVGIVVANEEGLNSLVNNRRLGLVTGSLTISTPDAHYVFASVNSRRLCDLHRAKGVVKVMRPELLREEWKKGFRNI